MDELISKRAVIEAIEKARANVGHNLEHSIGKSIIEILDDVGRDINGLPSALGTNLAEAGTDCISRQSAIDAIDVLCQEHRYKIPGKRETYSQYNEAWQDALDRAEGSIGNLPPAEPQIVRCKDCEYYIVHRKNGVVPVCGLLRGSPIRNDDDFCSRAERRTE